MDRQPGAAGRCGVTEPRDFPLAENTVAWRARRRDEVLAFRLPPQPRLPDGYAWHGWAEPLEVRDAAGALIGQVQACESREAWVALDDLRRVLATRGSLAAAAEVLALAVRIEHAVRGVLGQPVRVDPDGRVLREELDALASYVTERVRREWPECPPLRVLEYKPREVAIVDSWGRSLRDVFVARMRMGCDARPERC